MIVVRFCLFQKKEKDNMCARNNPLYSIYSTECVERAQNTEHSVHVFIGSKEGQGTGGRTLLLTETRGAEKTTNQPGRSRGAREDGGVKSEHANRQFKLRVTRVCLG